MSSTGKDELPAPILKQITVNPVDGQPDTFSSIPENHYLPSRSISVFGGQVISQAIASAYVTIPDGLAIHSFHGSFLDRTDPKKPITYKVTRLRTGNTISPRLTQAFQDDKLVFTANISFHKFEEQPVIKYNPHLSSAFPKLDKMSPITRAGYYRLFLDDGKTEEDIDLLAAIDVKHHLPGPQKMSKGEIAFEVFDFVSTILSDYQFPLIIDYLYWATKEDKYIDPTTILQHLKVNGRLPEDPKYHAAAFAFASDAFSSQLPAVVLQHENLAWVTSLDHVIYFHKPFDPTQWLAVENFVSVAEGGRALVEMRYWNANRELVATAIQEGLFRAKSKPKAKL